MSRPQAAESGVEPPAQRALALALLLGMFAAGALIEADANGARLFGVEGPECPSRLVLPDHGCPGCGLTRATAMILDGDTAGATRLHPGAWLVVVLGAAGTLMRAALLVSPRKSDWIHRQLRNGRLLFLGGLPAIWLARLARPRLLRLPPDPKRRPAWSS